MNVVWSINSNKIKNFLCQRTDKQKTRRLFSHTRVNLIYIAYRKCRSQPEIRFEMRTTNAFQNISTLYYSVHIMNEILFAWTTHKCME